MTTLAFVAQWALRSAAIVVVATLLLRVCRMKDASVRLAVYVAVLFASLSIPMLSAIVPAVPLITLRPASVSEAVPIVTSINVTPESNAPAVVQETQVSPRSVIEQVALALYISIAGILLLRLIVGLALGLRMLRGSRRTGESFGGIELRESERVVVPVTLGLIRAAIVLPLDWRHWEGTKLEAVLAHERSHVARWDPLIQAISGLHRALVWFCPTSWFLHRQIVRVAEEASDDAALAVVRDRASYAGILLDFMRGCSRATAWEGVAMARNGRPEDRIRRILNETVISRGVSLRTAIVIAALISPMAYVAAAARPVQASLPAPIAFQFAAPALTPLAQDAAQPEPSIVPPPPRSPAVPPAPAQAPKPPQTPTQPAASSAPQAGTSAIRNYVIVDGDSMTMTGSWTSDDLNGRGDLRARYGEHFAWFRQNGHDYVITDAAILADIDKAMEPQKAVNRSQATVNDAQAKVNALQAKVNAHQGDVNAAQNEVNHRQNLVNEMQAAVNHGDDATLIQKLEAELKELRAGKEANQANVNRLQSQVNEEQSGVNAEQSKVNAMQHKVNDEQRSASAEINRSLQTIFSSALQRGVARQVN